MEATNVLAENITQLVSFTMQGEEFAFPIKTVQEIVRLPEVTPVPRAPESVKGIINLRGSILPLIDLRKCFERGTAQYSEDSRVIVIRHQGYNTGMIVDRVNEVLRVEKDQLEPPPPAVKSARPNGLGGLARFDNGRRVVMILSEDELLPEAQETLKEMTVHNTAASSQEKQAAMEEENLLVSFRLNNEEFAVNITDVREIVRVGDIIRVPRAPAFVLGVMPLRNELLPVLDLRVRFGMIPDPGEMPHGGEAETDLPDNETDSRRVIVADLDGITTGLLVSSVSEVLRLSEKDIEPAPDVIDPENAKYIRGVGKLDNGNRLLMLLELAELLSGKDRETVAAAGKQQEKGEDSMGVEKDLEDERQLVCFRIADEEYGIDIMQVREIIRIDAITAVPGAPHYVSGIVNLRGNVLPVIDLRCRFGREKAPRSEQNRILVVELDGRTTGLIVDAVSEVLRIPEGCIEPTPRILSSGVSSRYITGIGKLDGGKRAIILVDVDVILGKEEIEALPGADGMEQWTSEAPQSHISQEPVQQNDFDSKNESIKDNDNISDSAVISNSSHEVISSEAKTTATETDLAELVTATVENAEEGEIVEERAEPEIKIRELMKLKKDQLLARARELGLKVDAKMTKKEISGLIAAST